MGLFDKFRKKEKPQEAAPAAERLENYPELMSAKLLFFESPELNSGKILEELRHYFANVESPGGDKALLYFFPDIQIELKDQVIPAQCSIFIPDDAAPNATLPEEAFQQNWHWKDANETAGKCRYEVLVTDLMTRTLDYKTRTDLFVKFLAAAVKATGPQAVYIPNSQKIIDPATVAECVNEPLACLANVRLYNISNSEKNEMLMDTAGLSSLGLPDFQLVIAGADANAVASLLWNYAYYIFENGDIIEDGNTLQGFEPGSKWKSQRQVSLITPERIVISMDPS